MGSISKDAGKDIEMTVINNTTEQKSDESMKIEEYNVMPVATDGRYGWVVVAAAAVQSSICLGNVAAFGIFAVEFIEYFRASTASVAWIGSILLFMVAPAGLYTVLLLKKLSARKVAIITSVVLAVSCVLTSVAPNTLFIFFSMGILTGGTYPMIVTCGQVVLQNYFHKRRARALSLSLCGPAVAIFVWPPVTRFLIDTYNWRGASLIFAGINLNCVVCGSLLRPPPMKRVPKTAKQVGTKASEDNPLQTGSPCATFMDKYITRILMFMGWYGIHAGHMLMVIYTPIRANVLHIDKTKGALLLSTVGIVSGLVRLVAGFIGDLKCVRRNALAGAFGIYCGALTLISNLFQTFEGLIVYCALFGIGGGVYVGLQGACVYDVVGLKHIAQGYMITSIAYGLTSLITVSTAGYLYDLTGSPFAALLTFGIIQVLGGTSLCCIPVVQAYQRKRKESRQNKILQLEKSHISRLKEQSERPFTHSVEHDLGQTF